jgi:ferrous iron transport protein B
MRCHGEHKHGRRRGRGCHDGGECSAPVSSRILLMGNPNVGKSVIFSQLTGINVISSNYPGTTVNFTEGSIKLRDRDFTLIDVPGTYSLQPSSEAEAVAVKFMENGALAVICVLDAGNLERNLKMGIEMKKYNIPVIYALNLLDVAKRKGVEINDTLLSALLGAPVIPTVAVKNRGIAEIKAELEKIIFGGVQLKTCPGRCAGCLACGESGLNYAERAREITAKVRKRTDAKRGFVDKLGELLMKPLSGIPIALVVLGLSLGFIVVAGEFIREDLLMFLVDTYIVPFFKNLFSSFIPEGVFLNILIGEYGIFVIAFEWIFALVLPYVFLFYVVFSFLEDCGYLPRLSVLFDNIMRKIGVQGGSLIPIAMGYGCAVPAIIGTRVAATKKERLIITTVICFAVPCISQTGALISLLGSYSYWLLALMAAMSFVLIMVVSAVAGKVIKGKIEPLILEVPNLLIPEKKAYFKKLMIRMRHFLRDAEGPMLIAIILAALIAETGVLNVVGEFLKPVVSGWLGLPEEAALALILGIIRREMAAAPLLALNLTPLQVFVGSTVALLYLPCISVFAVIVKEFNLKTALIISVSTTAVAILTGGIINQVASLFM